MVTTLSFEDIAEEIETRFYNNWDQNTIPIKPANVQKAAGAGNKDLAKLNEFVSINVFMPDVTQSELTGGDIRKRINGFVQIQHYIKQGKGTRLQYRAIDTAKAIFENPNQINGITYRPGLINNSIGEVEGFHQITLTVPFFTFTTG